MIRIGLAGCGRVAQAVHLPLLIKMPQVRIVAAADPSSEALGEIRNRVPEAALYQDPVEMMDGTGLDAVIVSVPTGLHAACAREVLKRNLALYLEKPLAADLDDGLELMRLHQSLNPRPTVMVGYNFRRDPLIQQMKRAVSSGRIGRLLCLHSVNCMPGSGDSDWRNRRDAGGGVLLDLASHHFDLWRFVTGQEIETVRAHLNSVRREHDAVAVEAGTSSGVICHGHFSSVGAMAHRIEIYGEQGRLAVDLIESNALEYTPGHTRQVRLRRVLRMIGGIPYLLKKRRSPWWTPSYQDTLRDFVRAVADGQELRPNLEDGFRALQVVSAAEESARSQTLLHCSALKT